MKNKMMKKVCALCAAMMVLGAVAGCGGSSTADQKTETPAAQNEQTAESEAAETPATEEAAESTEAPAATTVEGLLEQVADEDSYLVLSGVADGWAPTVMVLLNDGTFYCLVDYAGQATVNFCQGEYVTNDDGSITATGALYTDNSELVYEIACEDGTCTTSVAIPDTDATGELTGTLAE